MRAACSASRRSFPRAFAPPACSTAASNRRQSCSCAERQSKHCIALCLPSGICKDDTGTGRPWILKKVALHENDLLLHVALETVLELIERAEATSLTCSVGSEPRAFRSSQGPLLTSCT